MEEYLQKLAEDRNLAAARALATLGGGLTSSTIRGYKNRKAGISPDEIIKKELLRSGYPNIANNPMLFRKFKILLKLPQRKAAVEAGKMLSGAVFSASTDALKDSMLQSVRSRALRGVLDVGSAYALGAAGESLIDKGARRLVIDKTLRPERIRRYAKLYGKKLSRM
jgi:hypothetical protein